MMKCLDIKTAISIHLVGLINTGYYGANNFGMQEGRKIGTTSSSTQDDLTLNINSAWQ